jgi:hypothetical protein
MRLAPLVALANLDKIGLERHFFSTLAVIVKWAESQPDVSTLSEAIRRLVEIGLTVKTRPKQPSPARAKKANEMAAKQLDRLVDKSAPVEEQASRKQRLLKGPEEFRNVRIDRAKTKD